MVRPASRARAICGGRERSDGLRSRHRVATDSGGNRAGTVLRRKSRELMSRSVANMPRIALQPAERSSLRHALLRSSSCPSSLAHYDVELEVSLQLLATVDRHPGADGDGNRQTAAIPRGRHSCPRRVTLNIRPATAPARWLAHGLEQFFGTKRLDITLTSTSVPGKALAQLRTTTRRTSFAVPSTPESSAACTTGPPAFMAA